MLLCIGCEWKMRSNDVADEKSALVVERYDRLQSLYLTTGDFSALQQMNTRYPMQTRTLIEDVLRIGKVDDPEINTRFLNFYQDTTLQSLIAEVQTQYANMDDVSRRLDKAFDWLEKALPGFPVPEVYTQIGSLDQSVIVAGGSLGVSLDKYLGADYPLYHNPRYGYSDRQRRMMTRRYIVPDCVGFYLLSLYPMPQDRELSQLERDLHMGKIQWVVNKALGEAVFDNLYVKRIARYMKAHRGVSVEQLLSNNDYDSLT